MPPFNVTFHSSELSTWVSTINPKCVWKLQQIDKKLKLSVKVEPGGRFYPINKLTVKYVGVSPLAWCVKGMTEDDSGLILNGHPTVTDIESFSLYVV
jgi:hypothetical protein